ncbi:MAG: SCP2 sterol-binding domain-containing protein [Sphingomonadaceae bacterium]
MSLSEITERLEQRIAAEEALPGKIVLLDFGDDGVVRIDGTVTPAIVDNANGAADCRVRVGMDDFIDIAKGRKSPQMAYMTGMLKIEGDMGIAMQIGKMLG